MDNEDLKNAPVDENKPVEDTPKNDVEAIVKDLLAKGTEKEEIVNALNQMAKEGKITDEDLQKGLALLEKPLEDEANDEKTAEKWFGMKFIK